MRFTTPVRTIGVLAFALLRLHIPFASASVAYTAGTGSNTVFTTTPGGTVNVPIYVRQFGISSEISNDGGLFSAGFAVQQASAPSASNSIIVGLTANSTLFDVSNPGSVYSDTAASLWVDQSGGTVSSPAVPTGGLLQIGTITLQAASVIGITSYSIADFDPSSNSVQCLTYNGSELDSAINSNGPVMFSVSTAGVPEPSCITGVVALVGLFFRRPIRC